jgi:glycosyltransferase involved in cell wall biosynthesis
MPDTPQRATLSVAIITFNEEENIGRTLASVKDIADEIIVVDSGSTDRTIEIAKQLGAKVFVEEWKGFAAQKNSALDKCTRDWILSLDADEEVDEFLSQEIQFVKGVQRVPSVPEQVERFREETRKMRHLVHGGHAGGPEPSAYFISRKNLFLNKWIRHGGFYPDRKLRLMQRGMARFATRSVHESIEFGGVTRRMRGDLVHHQYPTLTAYVEHMNRYSSLGAEMVVEKRKHVGFSILNIVVRPIATFIYNYFLRLGFLDGKEGLLLHLYHSVYVSWKYAKAWEISRNRIRASKETSRSEGSL